MTTREELEQIRDALEVSIAEIKNQIQAAKSMAGGGRCLL
jgi:hypothetical protein